MNKKFMFLASLCVILLALTVSAQDKKVDFSGDWTLDAGKSELGERSRIESMTMKVSQTETELSVERKAKLAEREDSGNGRRPGGGGMRGGGGFGGDGDMSFKYDLSGKETKAERGGEGRFSGEVKLKAKSEKDGKLKLTQTRNIETQMGSLSIKTVETWELSADGKTLTVSSETETPRGNRSLKMVFTKVMSISTFDSMVISRTSGSAFAETKPVKDGYKIVRTAPPATDNVKQISSGVVNGRAKNLVTPKYPAAARAAGVKGSVNVRVIIDKSGNVVEAEAVSGDVLLQKAAVEAAINSTFETTYLEGVPVEVLGVIVYNFQ